MQTPLTSTRIELDVHLWYKLECLLGAGSFHSTSVSELTNALSKFHSHTSNSYGKPLQNNGGCYSHKGEGELSILIHLVHL